LPTAKKTYQAEVVLTLYDSSTNGIISEDDMLYAAIEAESKLNQIGEIEYMGNTLDVRLHLKGEDNGNNQNQDLARWESI
jgi:hypothetical protein